MNNDKNSIKNMEDLLKTTSNTVRSSADDWQLFLETASKSYKYRFAEQLLIHAQNPNATACATMDFWTKKTSRLITSNKNAISILKKDENQKPYISYLFDVKDTKETKISKPVNIWELQEDYQYQVIKGLERKYGETTKHNFTDILLELTENALTNDLDLFLEYFDNSLNKSSLCDLDIETRQEIFKNLTLASTQYIVLARCGIDPDLYIDKDNFKDLSLIDLNSVMAVVGNTCQVVTEDILTSISKICLGVEMYQAYNIEQNTQNFENTLEFNSNIEYNRTTIDKSLIDIEFIEDDFKGDMENENTESSNTLYQSERLQSSKLGVEQGNEQLTRHSGEMGSSERGIFGEQGANNGNVDRRNSMDGYLPNGQVGDTTVQYNNGETTNITESVGTNEEQEQETTTTNTGNDKTPSGGNNTDGIHLYSNLTTEQLNKIISHSINFDEKSHDIVAFFNNTFGEEERINFLKNLIVDEKLTLFQGDVLGFEIKPNDTISLFAGSGVNKIAETNLTLDEFSGYIDNVLIDTLEPIEEEINIDISSAEEILQSVEENLKEIHENYVKENPFTVFDEVSTIIEPIKIIMYSDLGDSFKTKVDNGHVEDREVEVFTNENGKEFAFFYADFGNGTLVSNMLDIQNNDYVKVCNINLDDTIRYYVDDLPPLAIEKLEKMINPIASIEMSTEDNMNMIDGIHNNTTPETEDVDLEQEIISIIDTELFESDRLKRSSKSNTLTDFQYAFEDVVDDTIVDMYTELQTREDFQEIQKMLNNLLNTKDDENSKYSQIFNFSKMEQVYNSFKVVEPITNILENKEIIEEFKNIILDNENLLRWANANTLDRFSSVYDNELDNIIVDVYSNEYTSENQELFRLAESLLNSSNLKEELFDVKDIYNNLIGEKTQDIPYNKLTDEDKQNLLSNSTAINKIIDELFENKDFVRLGASIIDYQDLHIVQISKTLSEIIEDNTVDGSFEHNDLTNLSLILLGNPDLIDDVFKDFYLFENIEEMVFNKNRTVEIEEPIETTNNNLDDIIVDGVTIAKQTFVDVNENIEPTMTKEQALEIVANNGEQLWTLDDKFKDDFDVVMQAVTIDNNEIIHKSHSPLIHASEQLKDNEEIVRKAIEETGWALKYASPRLQNDKELVMLAVADLPRVLGEVSERLQNDPDVVNLILDSNSQYDCFHCIGNELKEQFGYKPLEFTENFKNHFDKSNSKEFAIEQVKENGLELENLPDFQDDEDVVRIAIADDGRNIVFASDRIKDDKDIMLIACDNCRGDNLAFESASDRLKNDKDFVMQAIEFYGNSYKYVSDELKSDEDIMLKALKTQEVDVTYFPDNIENKEIMLNIPTYYDKASDELKNDKDLIKLALETNNSIFENLSDDIKEKWGNDPNTILLNITNAIKLEQSIEETEQSFTYYSTQRPIGIGTYPKDGLIDFDNYDDKSFVANINENAWGEIHYSRELTQDELSNFDLVKELSPDELVLNSIATQIGEFAKSSVNPIIEDFKNGEFEMYQDYLEEKGADGLLDVLNNYIDTQNEPMVTEENPLTPKQMQATEFLGNQTDVEPIQSTEQTLTDEEYANYKEIAISTIQGNGGMQLEYFMEIFQDDEDVVMTAIKNESYSFCFASDRLKNDENFVMQALEVDGLCLIDVNKELQNNPDIVKFAIENDYRALQYASDELKSNPSIIEFAIEKNGLALEFSSDELKNNEDTVLKAIDNNVGAFSFASPEMQQNLSVLYATLTQDRKMFYDVDSELKEKYGDNIDIFIGNIKDEIQSTKDKNISNEEQENMGQVGTHLNDDENKVVSYVSDRLNKNNSLTPIALTTGFEDFKEQTHTKSYNLLRGMLSTLRDKGLFEATKSLISSYKDNTQKFLIAFNDDKLETLYNSLREPKVIDILANENNFSNIKRTAIDKVLNRTYLEDLADLWKNEKDVVMVACAINGNNLQFATPKIQNDIDVVKIAINTTPTSIKFASDEIKQMLETNDIEVPKQNVISNDEPTNTPTVEKVEKKDIIENVGQVGTHLNDDEKVAISKEQSLNDILPKGKEIHIDNMHLFVDKIDKNYVIFDDKAMIDIGMQSVMKVQIELSRVLEHLEKEKIKSNVVNLDEVINQDEFSSDDIFGFTDEIDEFIEEIKYTKDMDNRINYQIKNVTEENSSFSPKEKFESNINAIKTLKNIESENRLATPDEQEILSKYVGWGGLSNAFDERKSDWSNEFKELKNLLTTDEYDNAKKSTMTAFYTPSDVVDTIYKALKDMGLPDNVSILDSSAGIGNFLGKAEETFNNCKLSGTELDSITGRIAQQLYQKANIEVKGFQNTQHQNNSFDVSVGNVPFGDTKVADNDYDKLNFFIHDYFFAKNIDKVRDGGIIALVTSKGTLDKKDNKVREYINERANFLGAIRLPDTTFKDNANTTVTSDIIFLQKNDNKTKEEIQDSSNWLNLATNDNDITMNSYFVDNPTMIMGTMEVVSGRFGDTEVCKPDTTSSLKEQLEIAIQNLEKPNQALLHQNIIVDEKFIPIENLPISVDFQNVDNFSFIVADDRIFYKDNKGIIEPELSDVNAERITMLIGIKEKTLEILDLQINNCNDNVLSKAQDELNTLYDDFVEKHGLINRQVNKSAFKEDKSYHMLSALEDNIRVEMKTKSVSRNGKVKELKNPKAVTVCDKADIFFKRTINGENNIDKVDNSIEALGVSIGKLGKVDLKFMQELIDVTISFEQIIEDLRGIIFKNPLSDVDDILSGWENYDEYLSGNVREKLEIAEKCSQTDPDFLINVEYLKEMQPEPIKAVDIEVNLGASWIDLKYYNQFMFENFETPFSKQNDEIAIQYSPHTTRWNIKGKSKNEETPFDVRFTNDNNQVTDKVSAYKILENILNRSETKVYSKVKNKETGKEESQLDMDKTLEVQLKSETIQESFKDWIFKDPDRRKELVTEYNKVFNSTRPREFSGEHLEFSGMNTSIKSKLNEWQKNAIARVLYGGNTLIGHCVGAGKTFTMIASAIEGKKIGVHNKSMIVVPKHLIKQVGKDVSLLYPSAKVLVATDEDFKPTNRKRFCSKIATGDYDLVVMGHTQFEKIPLSKERQEQFIKDEIRDIDLAITSSNGDENDYSVKGMEKTKANLETKLEKVQNKDTKDNVVTFEQLGVDKIFVDEAHEFKNLLAISKMQNISGINSVVDKSIDMYSKCKYLNDVTNEKGVVFATGTPVTNSIVELFNMMRYLQPTMLKKMNLTQFDSWASVFAKETTTNEIKPSGKGWRIKTRLAKFFNVPELMRAWKNVADIKTQDMINLIVPEVKDIEPIVVKPSAIQSAIIDEFVERAMNIEQGKIPKAIDNPLKITIEGRLLALDQRAVNPLMPDEPDSKINTCVNKVFEIYQNTNEEKSTQMIFCDLCTPKTENQSTKATNKESNEVLEEDDDGLDMFDFDVDLIPDTFIPDNGFNAYQDIKDKLISLGVPPKEIAFIHDANTDKQKDELFAKVRSGEVRVILGSTKKMGTGTNCQTKLIALHHLDTPWRPSDLEQQEGRIVRQGNENPEVAIYTYVTQDTFDAYSWQILQRKQESIDQIYRDDNTNREIDDVDGRGLDVAEIKSLCTSNPLYKEQMELNIEIKKLERVEKNFKNEQHECQEILKENPDLIKKCEKNISELKVDIVKLKDNPITDDNFQITIQGEVITDREKACKEIEKIVSKAKPEENLDIGEFRGFKIKFTKTMNTKQFHLENLKSYTVDIINNGNTTMGRVENLLNGIQGRVTNLEERIGKLNNQIKYAKANIDKPFELQGVLPEKRERLATVNSIIISQEQLKVLEKQDNKTEKSILDQYKPSKETVKQNLIAKQKAKQKAKNNSR